MQNLSRDYIIGLIDGEGSFTVFLRDDGKYRRVEMHFFLKMQEEELPLLRSVKSFFGCGYISFQKDKRRNHRNCYRYEVGSIKDLKEKVVPVCKGRLQSKKRKKDFEIFCRILEKVERKEHLTEKGWNEILKLKGYLHK